MLGKPCTSTTTISLAPLVQPVCWVQPFPSNKETEAQHLDPRDKWQSLALGLVSLLRHSPRLSRTGCQPEMIRLATQDDRPREGEICWLETRRSH